MGKIKDITGEKFGKLTVINCAGKLDGKNYFWNCQCDCGQIKPILGTSLRNGNTKSCGCGKFDGFKKHNEQQTQETLIPIGTRFGKLIIVQSIGYKPQYEGAVKNRMWYLCQCDCGNICETHGNLLKSNAKISCGCINSRGENKIEELLKANDIFYNKEVILPELVAEEHRRLRFDFIIYSLDGAIERIVEFDGRQHSQGPDTNYWGHSTDTLESIQEKDMIKNNFCARHNYKLVRIPCTKINKITIDDILGEEYLIRGDEL